MNSKFGCGGLMHDAAYRIGGLVIGAYLPVSPAKILEVGSKSISRNLKDHSPRNSEYTRLNVEGDRADVVVANLKLDANFDLVIASSIFGHDKSFWRTFIEMCKKVKSGGHIYINVPSNGAVRRFPKDYWRFYPDAGLALEGYARSEGFDLSLVESFTTEREEDDWNDFCAIFRRGPSNAEMNRDFVHNKVRCTNAINWRSSLIVNAVDDSEDMRLLRQARETVLQVTAFQGSLEAQLEEIVAQKAASDERLKSLLIVSEEQGRRLQILSEELDRERGDAGERQRSLEVQLAEFREQNAVAEECLQVRFREIANLTRLVQERDRKLSDMATKMNRSDGQERELQALTAELERERAESVELKRSFEAQAAEFAVQKAAAEGRLQERFREVAKLTQLIQERDQRLLDMQGQIEWLCRVISVLTKGFATSNKARWLAWIPAYFGHKWQKKSLKEQGLFDHEDYVSTYPDVLRANVDPLRHYVNHGIKEGRIIKRGA
ncbi:hypothetical protein [Burkholderia contaminans]|uniref:Methyltransferase type 11 domain-containing protein n=6 Tax=Pseudomonadota TaxID=1224 RepID=A0ABD7Y2B7_9BURK|nr:hypothetical protein [Burkholderia contaminans]MBY4852191.1 hypothetical protein [Burkholderia contaminans]QDS25460.1 hypothetical protein FPQ37_03940 [Burkholderia contaminans]WFN19069.1 hypothetical protein LXE91_08665 [Burkholderia contaminans]